MSYQHTRTKVSYQPQFESRGILWVATWRLHRRWPLFYLFFYSVQISRGSLGSNIAPIMKVTKLSYSFFTRFLLTNVSTREKKKKTSTHLQFKTFYSFHLDQLSFFFCYCCYCCCFMLGTPFFFYQLFYLTRTPRLCSLLLRRSLSSLMQTRTDTPRTNWRRPFTVQ